MVTESIDLQRILDGLTYKEFMELSVKKVEETHEEKLDESEKKLFGYSKLNLHRISRIEKTYKVSEQICKNIMKITGPQIWMVLTEDWCGDSAQNLPYIAKIADCNDYITLRILPRDKNLDIMDQYLTDGKSRSIPKLVAFDKNGNELFQWGPRPAEAQKLVLDLKAEGLSKNEYNEKLHLWYGRNRGKNIENEFVELLKAL
jgi:hypothetical protein